MNEVISFRTSKNNAVHRISLGLVSRYDDYITDCFVWRFDNSMRASYVCIVRPWWEMSDRRDSRDGKKTK